MNSTKISIHQSFDNNDIDLLAKNMTSSQEKLDFLNEYNFIGSGFSNSKTVEDFIKSNKDTTWMIKENNSGQNIGFLAIERAFINYWQLIIYLDKDFSNKGYGYESISLLLLDAPLIAKKINTYILKAYVNNNNVTAQIILEKNGFKLDNKGLRFKEYSINLNKQ